MNKVPKSNINDVKLYKFDTIGRRFEFYYNEVKDSYYVNDLILNTKTNLEIKIRKYKNFKDVKELHQIRYWFPTPHNIGRKVYTKSISDIKFKLFGEFGGNGGSPIKLTIKECKRIIKSKNEELGFFSFTDMSNSNDKLLKKVHTILRDNGGVSKFREIITELGINTEYYYRDDKGVYLTSNYEFIFFTILHFNKIKYKFEPFKIGTFEPDFYIPKQKILIEILGLTTRDYYLKRTKEKEKLYIAEGFNYKPIVVDRHHPRESIFKRCEEIFGKLRLPNYTEYNKKYIQTSIEFNEQLKRYLTQINEGKLKVSVKIDKSGFREKYRKYYDYVMNNYGTIQIGIKELVGIPTTKFKSVKIEQYWMNIDYVKDELENVFKNELRIPTKRETYIKFRKKYNIWNLYRFWGEKSLLKGGEFYEFIKKLKLKYEKPKMVKR